MICFWRQSPKLDIKAKFETVYSREDEVRVFDLVHVFNDNLTLQI